MDYISKPALMGKLTASDMQQKIKGMTGAEAYNEFLTMVNGTEKADVAPVRRGEWKLQGIKWKCSCCGVLINLDGTPEDNLLNYCPGCGADMRGADNGE